MIAECQNCGAPLDVHSGARRVRCSYCDTVNRARSMKTVSVHTPPSWQPPQVWTPPPQARQPSTALTYHTPKPPSAIRGVALGCGFTVLVMVVGAVAFFVQSPDGTLGSLGVGGLDPQAAPALGAWDPSQGPGAFHGSLALGVNVPTATDFACPHGSVQRNPTLNVTLPSLHLLTLRASTGGTPVVIARNSETGAWSCDFEHSGPASVTVALPAGTHAVWAGDLHRDPVQVELHASAESIEVMPLPSGLAAGASPTLASLDVVAQTEPYEATATVEGAVEGRVTDPQCRGWFPIRPQVALTVAEARSVVLGASSETHEFVLMRRPDGTVACADGFGSHQSARVMERLHPGTYEVWLGVQREGDTSSPAFTMGVPLAAEVLPSGIAPEAPPIAGEVALGRQPASLESTTAAEVEATQLRSDCRGHLPMRPHAVLVLDRERRVTITTRARPDLTAVVRTADGTIHCDDDSGRRNQPLLRVHLPAGRHAVWVGAYHERDADVPFTLRVAPD